ncbi:MAG: hypothetical protein K2R98_23775 [Gemmataceae bacterium]|nr:hypothetical protein [Gemmataceae bacterium]
MPLHAPFDPFYDDEVLRPKKDRPILRSTTLVLRVPESDLADPWLVLGKRAEELIGQSDATVTSLSAPKKYVRDWPDHLKADEPTTNCRGLMGMRNGLFPKLQFVELAVRQMLQLVMSSLTNPNFTSPAPILYPLMQQILLTYPLTWRKSDRDLFVQMVQTAADKLFVLDERLRKDFKVELVCSEPVAVAAYVLWEVFVGAEDHRRPADFLVGDRTHPIPSHAHSLGFRPRLGERRSRPNTTNPVARPFAGHHAQQADRQPATALLVAELWWAPT